MEQTGKLKKQLSVCLCVYIRPFSIQIVETIFIKFEFLD